MEEEFNTFEVCISNPFGEEAKETLSKLNEMVIENAKGRNFVLRGMIAFDEDDEDILESEEEFDDGESEEAQDLFNAGLEVAIATVADEHGEDFADVVRNTCLIFFDVASDVAEEFAYDADEIIPAAIKALQEVDDFLQEGDE